MFGEFPILCDLLGDIGHLPYEENALLAFPVFPVVSELGSVSWMFLPRKLTQELETFRNSETIGNFAFT